LNAVTRRRNLTSGTGDDEVNQLGDEWSTEGVEEQRDGRPPTTILREPEEPTVEDDFGVGIRTDLASRTFLQLIFDFGVNTEGEVVALQDEEKP
jgi:hypothetical protein